MEIGERIFFGKEKYFVCYKKKRYNKTKKEGVGERLECDMEKEIFRKRKNILSLKEKKENEEQFLLRERGGQG